MDLKMVLSVRKFLVKTVHMYTGKLVFPQVIAMLPWRVFQQYRNVCRAVSRREKSPHLPVLSELNYRKTVQNKQNQIYAVFEGKLISVHFMSNSNLYALLFFVLFYVFLLFLQN